MGRSIVVAAVLAVLSTVAQAQPAAAPAPAPAAAPAPAQAEAKDAAPASKGKTAKDAVRALNGGHRAHGPARISAAAKDANGVAVVPKKKPKPAADAAPASQK